jgi:hypothetical protein
MSGFLGSGNVLFNQLVGGAYQGFVSLGNCTEFALSEKGDQKTRESRLRGTAGQALSTVTRKKPSEFSITWDEQGSPGNVALSVHGTLADLSQSAAAAQTATPTLVLNRWVEIAAGVRNTTGVGITGKVLGTDFSVNERLGQIMALNAGTAGSQTVTYTRGARTGQVIDASTTPVIRGAFVLDGINDDGEEPVIVNVWDAVIQSASAFDPLSDAFATGKMTGFMNVPAGRNGPYRIEMAIVDA